MKIVRFLQGRHHAWQQRAAQKELLNRFLFPMDEITRELWGESLKNPTEFYETCFRYFHARLPEPFRAHRLYFENCGRGFGERAFHVMWFLLFREFKPESFLEIGVYRGQTISLAAMLAEYFKINCHVQGISPFSNIGDKVSKYRNNVDYFKDTLENFSHFNLPPPALLKAFSTDESAKKTITSRQWSFIYIDGNHDYEIARADWELCAAHLQPDGIIVLDDSALMTNYIPPVFATSGHPGPSRIAQEIDREKFQEILQVGHNRVFQKSSG
jgi:hypothetical protein